MLMGSTLGIIKTVPSLIFLNEVLGTLNSCTCFHSLQSTYNYSVHILWWRTRSDLDGKGMCFWSHIPWLGMLHWPFVCVMQSFATCPRCCNKGILLQDAVVQRVHSIYRIDARHQHDHSDLTDLIQLLLFLWENFTCWWSKNTLENSLWKRTDPALCVVLCVKALSYSFGFWQCKEIISKGYWRILHNKEICIFQSDLTSCTCSAARKLEHYRCILSQEVKNVVVKRYTKITKQTSFSCLWNCCTYM